MVMDEKVEADWDFTGKVNVEQRDGGWQVHLPHSCDEWDIAGGGGAVSREQAIANLEAFIADTGRALNALRNGESYGSHQRYKFGDD